MKLTFLILTGVIVLIFSGCAANSVTTGNNSGMAVKYEDIESTGDVAGLGIESQDISSMTDKMLRDMLATPSLAARSIAPRVIIDDSNFINESAAILNKRMITERLMVGLNRAAAGRIIFLERQAAAMVEKERSLKRQGVVSTGTMGNTRTVAGADFSLTGRIMSLASTNAKTGKISRYFEISFKMVDLETSVAVWTGLYEFKKTGQDDVVYR